MGSPSAFGGVSLSPKVGKVSYIIRKMTREDVPETLDMWRETGMLQGTHSLYTCLEVDKDAVNIAVKDTGEIIGVCSATIHHEDLAFMSLFAVRKPYRRLGIGTKLWNACLEHIGQRNALLNSVPHEAEKYRNKFGFPILETSWAVVIYETHDPVDHEALTDSPPEGVDILPFQESHLTAMFEYDLALMGYKREKLLELSCREEDSRTFVALEGVKCVGFGTIKMSCNGVGLVGPLYADHPNVAEVLLKKLIVSLPKAKGFAICTVNRNIDARKLIERTGCPVGVVCLRLCRKSRFKIDTDKVFASFNYSPF